MTQNSTSAEYANLTGSTPGDDGAKVSIVSQKSIYSAFDPLLLLQTPHRLVAPTAWIGHIPFAFWVIRAARPRVLVELGTHSGNSYCAFCQSIVEGNIGSTCYAVDTWQGDEQAGYYGQNVLDELTRYHDSRYGAFSTLIRSTFSDALGTFSDNTIDLLHIDGCHTYEAVKQDFEAWLPKLTRSGIVLFHDTNVRQGSFGVWQLWDELRGRYPSFNFSHSHGLGVLAIGEEIPPNLAILFQARGHQISEIHNLFGLIGTRLRESTEARLLVETSFQEAASARVDARKAAELSVAAEERRQQADLVVLKLEEVHSALLSLLGKQEALSTQISTELQIATLEAQIEELKTEQSSLATSVALLPDAVSASSNTQLNALTTLREAILSIQLELKNQATDSLGDHFKTLETQIGELKTEQSSLATSVAILPSAVSASSDTQLNALATLREAISGIQLELKTQAMDSLSERIAATMESYHQRGTDSLIELTELASATLVEASRHDSRISHLLTLSENHQNELQRQTRASGDVHNLLQDYYLILDELSAHLKKPSAGVEIEDKINIKSKLIAYEMQLTDLRHALHESQVEAVFLRERMSGLVLDTTIAWTRYSDMLGFLERFAGEGNHPNAIALHEVIQEGRLEARKAKAAVLKQQTETVQADRVGPPPKAQITATSKRAAVRRVVRRMVGNLASTQPSITIICAADEAETNFDHIIDFFNSMICDVALEIFALIPEDQKLLNSTLVNISEIDLVAQVNQIATDLAQGQIIVLASTTGVLNADWIEKFQNIFEKNALAAALCGLVLSEAEKIGWSGAIRTSESDWQIADRDLAVTDYRVASADRLDGILPGFVAFVPDIYRELGGLSSKCGSLAFSLLDLSIRIAETGFEIYRAPEVHLALSETGLGTSASLIHRFTSAATDVPSSLYRRRPRVLVVDALTPTPDKDAGSVDAFWGMQILRSLGYQITFLPMYNLQHAGRYTEALRSFGIYCPVSPQLKTPLDFIEQNGRDFDLIVLHRVTVAYILLDQCRRCAPQAKIVFHTQDLHFLREERHAALVQTPEAYAQAQGTRKEELRCIGGADTTIVVSSFEFDLTTKLLPNANIRLVPVMHPAPGRLAPRKGRDGVIFVGGFGHAPNVDAVSFLIDEIWDRVRIQLPNLTLRIIGSNAPENILAKHDLSRGIEVLGFVPDLVPHYMKAIVNIAPIRFGAGIKGKVLAALGVGVPTVATSIAAEGMGLATESDIILADDAQSIADAITRLCQDDDLWYRISDKGLVTCKADFSVDAQVPRWRSILRALSLPN